eukprot:scaffold45320_cov38-Prasinocladus_malaysianus.AAC.1
MQKAMRPDGTMPFFEMRQQIYVACRVTLGVSKNATDQLQCIATVESSVISRSRSMSSCILALHRHY